MVGLPVVFLCGVEPEPEGRSTGPPSSESASSEYHSVISPCLHLVPAITCHHHSFYWSRGTHWFFNAQQHPFMEEWATISRLLQSNAMNYFQRLSAKAGNFLFTRGSHWWSKYQSRNHHKPPRTCILHGKPWWDDKWILWVLIERIQFHIALLLQDPTAINNFSWKGR